MQALKLFISTLLLFFFISCSNKTNYNDIQQIIWSDFPETISLIGDQVDFNDMIMRPNGLFFIDSLLITRNVKTDHFFHIFNINTKSKIGECITMGRGPNEMIFPSFIPSDSEHISIFDLASKSIYMYQISDFISSPSPTPINKIILTVKEGEVAESVILLKDKILIPNRTLEYKFGIFDMEGNIREKKGEYPVDSDIEYTNNEKIKAYEFTFSTNNMDKIFAFHKWTDLIEVYDMEGILKRRIQGPDNFSPAFKERISGEFTVVGSVQEKTRIAYKNPICVNNEIFVLYNGGLFDDDEKTNQILVFDKEGNPLRKYLLNKKIANFAVDARNKIIYGINNDPEFHILRFHY